MSNVVTMEQYYKVIKLMTFEWQNNLIELKTLHGF